MVPKGYVLRGIYAWPLRCAKRLQSFKAQRLLEWVLPIVECKLLSIWFWKDQVSKHSFQSVVPFCWTKKVLISCYTPCYICSSDNVFEQTASCSIFLTMVESLWIITRLDLWCNIYFKCKLVWLGLVSCLMVCQPSWVI